MTGISTYIWICSKNKTAYREGKVQLIDVSHCYEARRKGIGTKRNDISDKCRELIVKAYGSFENRAVKKTKKPYKSYKILLISSTESRV